MTAELTVECPLEVFPKQAQFMSWSPTDRGPAVSAILGWWGSGKSTAAALKLLHTILQTKWTDAYGETRPQFAAMAPTAGIVRKTIIKTMESITPRELISKKVMAPYPCWTFVHGPQLWFVSADAKFEGETHIAIWLDEIHMPPIAGDDMKYANLLSRLRDPHAPKLLLICSGMPEAGWVRSKFDLQGLSQEERNARYTLLLGTRDNPTLPKNQVDLILSTLPAMRGLREAIEHGDWITSPELVFAQYDDDLHLVPDARADPNAPIHVGIDVGNHGSVVFGIDTEVEVQPAMGKKAVERGLLIIDEVATLKLGVEDMLLEAKKRPAARRVVRGESEVYIDPTAREDEVRIVRKHFAGCRVVQRPQRDDFYKVWPGIRLMQTSLRDGLGNVRLQFVSSLVGRRSGVIEAILSCRVSPRTGNPVKDDRVDHARDALRYLVQGRLGQPTSFPMTYHPR